MTDAVLGSGAFQVAQANVTGVEAPAATPQDATRADRFQAVFDRAAAERAEVTAAQPGAEANAADRQRALDTLQLGGEARPATGDSILGGLERLRGVFDAQAARVESVAGVQGSTGALIAAQFEVVQYTLLVDVTSKLTGKATQSFDTLMKGQ